MFDLSGYLWKTLVPLADMSESGDSPTSDNSIYYKIGKHKYEWAAKSGGAKDRIDRKYNIHGSNKRAGIIRYIKDVSPKILPNSEEIIHRDKWDLDGLIGETEYQLMHPHYWTLCSWILKSHKRKRDVLTIFECSNSKPYVTSKVRKHIFTDKYRAFSDMACMSNPGVIPLEHSQFYPYRYDEWDHFAEKPDIAKKYTWVCAARFLTYVKKLGYKHVIVMFQTPYTQEWAQMLHDENIEGCKSWMHIVNDPAFDKKILQKYKPKFGGSTGLVHQRMLTFPETTERYQRLLKESLSAEEKKEFEKLQDILKIESKSKLKEELKVFNEEHGVEPYEPEKGTKDTFELLDADKAATQSKVKEYEGYVKKFLEELPDKYEKAKEDKKWHTERVVFTVLDLLMDKNDDKLIDDPDTEYWNMWKAVHNLCDNNDDIFKLNSYCYCYKELVDDLDKKSVQKYCNKLGITQFWDERRRSPDK